MLRLLPISIVVSGTIVISVPCRAEPKAERFLTELRKLPQSGSYRWENYHYDMHGNADPTIQGLMRLRFEATGAICDELDRTNRDEFPRHVAALYHVLGFVKDPNSIPWLDKKFEEGLAAELFELWLPRWRQPSFLRGPGHEYIKWIESSGRWSAFFRSRLKAEDQVDRRLAILYAMQGWLHDADTLSFFVDLEKAPKVSGEELLIAQTYLHQHGRPLDAGRLTQAITELQAAPDGKWLLLEFADELRHPLFVPWLVSIVGPKSDNSVGNAQWVLEEITFRRDVAGREAWTKWYEQHRGETREEWAAQAVDEFLRLLSDDVERAKAFLDRAVYRWKDPLLLPHMERLLKHKVIHNDLVGWINLTYRPYWRERLQPIAERIIRESSENLESWANGLLKELDFLDSGKDTWAEHVRRTNMRI